MSENCGGSILITFQNFNNSESIICTWVIILPVQSIQAQLQRGDRFLPVCVFKISFERKVCPCLAIQKRKMEFKVTVVNEIALGFHVLEKEKITLRKY